MHRAVFIKLLVNFNFFCLTLNFDMKNCNVSGQILTLLVWQKERSGPQYFGLKSDDMPGCSFLFV